MGSLLISTLPIFIVLAVLFVFGIVPYAQASSLNSTIPNAIANQTTAAANSSKYVISFNTLPSIGNIVFNGNTYLNGNTIQVVVGNYQTSAIASAAFVFSNWSYTDNLSLTNLTSPNTIVTISGNGAITANFRALATFSENALPAGVAWSVAYGGIVQKATAPNSITFSVLPGNYIFSVANETVSNAVYIALPQSGYLVAGNTTVINFAPASSNTTTSATTSATTSSSTSTSSVSTTSSTTSTSSTSTTTSTSTTMLPSLKANDANALLALLSNDSISKNSLFISNSSIAGENENGTAANIIAPVALNYQEMSNITALSQNRINIARLELDRYYANKAHNKTHGSIISSYLTKSNASSIYSFNESVKVPYGNILQAHKYVSAGSTLHYLAYNTHGIVTYYNVSIIKAQPRLAIKVNGAVMAMPNSISIIHVPVLKGQKTYSFSLSLNSSIAQGNNANYSYEIKFSNGTTISKNITASAINYSKTFTLYTDQNATITFDTNGNGNYTAVDPTTIVIPTEIVYYAPVTLTNSQTTPTPAPFQQELSVNSLAYNTYEANNLDNIEFFYANGNIIPSWMEGSASNALLNNPSNSMYLYTSTNTIYWLNISSGIPADSNSISIYMGFASASTSLLNNVNVGEEPQISSTYGQYDDGADVFGNYFAGNSLSGWTVAGSANLANNAPSGSPFGANAFYADGSGGDYLNTSANGQSANMIIEYYTDTATLEDVFFLTDSSGAGQMGRLGYGGGWYGIASTSSWTSWSGPPDTGYWQNEWVLASIVVANNNATMYVSPDPGIYGSEIGQNASNTYAAADNGNFLGLIGDGGGGVSYWNGFIIRAYPPNGIMPSATFGSVLPTNAPVINLQSNPVNYGAASTITATSETSGDSVEIEESGNIIAGPAVNTIDYTICGTTPSLANCWAPGNYIITANDITNGDSSNDILTVDKGIPTLSLPATNIIMSSGGSASINYGISTVGNQLTANLIADGTSVSSTTSNSNTYSLSLSSGFHTLEVTTAGNGNYVSSNIIRQYCVVPTPSQLPNDVSHYAPLCVINNQSTSTSAPFQTMINITENAYPNYIAYNGNLANFEVFGATGAVQPAWIESNSSGKLITWVKLATSIGANSISPLYLGFAANTFNMLSNTGTSGIGENPTATSTYGQYDDGAGVFNLYDNFAGTSLNPNLWTNYTGSGAITVDNSLTISTTGAGTILFSKSIFSPNIIGEAYIISASATSMRSATPGFSTSNTLTTVGADNVASPTVQWSNGGYNNGDWMGSQGDSTAYTQLPTTLSSTGTLNWFLGVGYTSTTDLFYGISKSDVPTPYSNFTSSSTDMPTGNVYFSLGIGGGGVTSGNIDMQYTRVRAYPPNGIMPTILFGNVSSSVSSTQNTCTISLSTSAINFANVGPGNNIAATNAVTDDNTGNSNAYMYIYGGNWIGPAQFGVSNTIWAPSSGVPFASANMLSAAPENTLLLVPSSGSNTIYFGLGVPAGTPAGYYSQNIMIENSC